MLLSDKSFLMIWPAFFGSLPLTKSNFAYFTVKKTKIQLLLPNSNNVEFSKVWVFIIWMNMGNKSPSWNDKLDLKSDDIIHLSHPPIIHNNNTMGNEFLVQMRQSNKSGSVTNYEIFNLHLRSGVGPSFSIPWL